MALIKCIECGKLVSNFAQCCPHCGYPIQQAKLKSEFYFLCDFEENACLIADIFPIQLTVGDKVFTLNFNDLFSKEKYKASLNGGQLIKFGECFTGDVELNENNQYSVEVNYSEIENPLYPLSLQNEPKKEYSIRPSNISGFSLGINYYFTFKYEYIEYNEEDAEEVVRFNAFSF